VPELRPIEGDQLAACHHPLTESLTTCRQSRPQQVAEAIKSWVVEQGMRPGDKLPSEPELIERFGMAKSTIREAVRILEAQGLVKSRTGPGGGVFIHAVSEERATALLGNYFFFRNLSIARDLRGKAGA
jgi:GntR family transcriptional regulator, transcriptional repressor for pyruvate dehydrogenase complex